MSTVNEAYDSSAFLEGIVDRMLFAVANDDSDTFAALGNYVSDELEKKQLPIPVLIVFNFLVLVFHEVPLADDQGKMMSDARVIVLRTVSAEGWMDEILDEKRPDSESGPETANPSNDTLGEQENDKSN